MGHSRMNPDWPKSNWPKSSILHTSRQGKRKASLPLPTPLKFLSTLGAVQGRKGGASEDPLAPLPLLVGRCGPRVVLREFSALNGSKSEIQIPMTRWGEYMSRRWRKPERGRDALNGTTTRTEQKCGVHGPPGAEHGGSMQGWV